MCGLWGCDRRSGSVIKRLSDDNDARRLETAVANGRCCSRPRCCSQPRKPASATCRRSSARRKSAAPWLRQASKPSNWAVMPRTPRQPLVRLRSSPSGVCYSSGLCSPCRSSCSRWAWTGVCCLASSTFRRRPRWDAPHPSPGSNGCMLALATPVQFYVGWQYYVGAYKVAAQRLGQHGCAGCHGLFGGLLLLACRSFSAGSSGHVYFETAAVIITLIKLGKFLEVRAKGRTSEAIKKLMGLRAKTARIDPRRAVRWKCRSMRCGSATW